MAHCKPVGSGEKALVYLGCYLYRGILREQDIFSCGNGQVTFRYRDAKTGRLEKRSLAGADFPWWVLQHALPRGFRRARNYGFLHANCKRLIILLYRLLRFDPGRFAPMPRERPPLRCTGCGAAMAIVRTPIRSASPKAAAPPPAVRGIDPTE